MECIICGAKCCSNYYQVRQFKGEEEQEWSGDLICPKCYKEVFVY